MDTLHKITLYTTLTCVWFANINDLIRGSWFYQSTGQIIFWNMLGILVLIIIIKEREKLK